MSKLKVRNLPIWFSSTAVACVLALTIAACAKPIPVGGNNSGSAGGGGAGGGAGGNGNGGGGQNRHAVTPKQELDELLDSLSFEDFEVKGYSNSVNSGSGFYSVDNDGRFYYEDASQNQTDLELRYNPNIPVLDPKNPSKIMKQGDYEFYTTSGAPFSTFDVKAGPIGPTGAPIGAWTGQNVASFADRYGLAKIHRARAIHYMKTKNRDCYYQLAATRLNDPSPYEELIALDRAKDPRPLLFKSDEQWDDFKKDIIALFKPFGDPDAHVVILGTSTTFFSNNPMKGSNASLIAAAPACETSDLVYSFDTPNKAFSDLDIHIFVPSLSHLCQLVHVKGNDGNRETYWENHIDRCFSISKDPAVKAMVKSYKAVLNANVGGMYFNTIGDLMRVAQQKLKNVNKLSYTMSGSFLKFLQKWDQELNHREINFSVRILPGEMNPTYGKQKPIFDFTTDPLIQSRFAIEIK